MDFGINSNIEIMHKVLRRSSAKSLGELNAEHLRRVNVTFKYKFNIFQITTKLLKNLKSVFKSYNLPDRFNGECKLFQEIISFSFIHPKQNNIWKINDLKTLKDFLFQVEMLHLSIILLSVKMHLTESFLPQTPR